MKRFFTIAAACAGLLLFSSSGHADFVCQLRELNKDFLAVLAGPDPGAIELTRLGPEVIVQVVERSSQGVWVKITSPGRPSGWVAAKNICPGQP